MQAVIKQRPEAERAHSGDQSALIVAVALMAGADAALLGQFFQRLSEGQHGMGR